MIELDHSPLGGSGANRWINCAGSFLKHRENLRNGTHEDVPSEFAERGTGAHELAARCVSEIREPFEFIGEEFNGFKAGFPDGIELDAVAIYVEECLRLIDRDDPKEKVLIEETIHLPEIHPLLKGTVDFGIFSPTRGVILRDYKNGEGIGVAALRNPQLLYYAFLFAMKFPWLRASPRDTRFSLGIVQPNFYGIFEEPDVWETDLGTVLDWGHNVLLPKMQELTERSDIRESDFRSGEHCQFCPVMLECPLLQRAFLDYAEGTEFLSMLTDNELNDLYAKREDARRFMKELETTVYHRLVGGSEISSGKLVAKRTARKWKPGASAALVAALGDKAMTKPEIKSPAQIEKLSTRGKELALEYGFKPEADALSLAPITDPRPAVKGSRNERVFAGFEQSPEEAGW
jgi:hypothetical protein